MNAALLLKVYFISDSSVTKKENIFWRKKTKLLNWSCAWRLIEFDHEMAEYDPSFQRESSAGLIRSDVDSVPWETGSVGY